MKVPRTDQKLPDKKPVLKLQFCGDTGDLLKKSLRGHPEITYPLTRNASIKDIIESLGVPHTEVGALVLEQSFINFHFLPVGGERIRVLPVNSLSCYTEPSVLRPCPLQEIRFIVDINIAKAGRLLRMAGIDAEPSPPAGKMSLAAIAADRPVIVLTRNKDLLKHSAVTFGRLLRSEDSLEQFREIALLFDLYALFKPFTRCLDCNGRLEHVEKEKIISRLEPLTKKYYNNFKACTACLKIFWRGSHHRKMTTLLQTLIR